MKEPKEELEQNKIAECKLKSDPESAAKTSQKFYKARITDQKTHETKEIVRPIFIKKKKDESLTIEPAYLYKFFELSEHVIYLRNNALGTEIRYLYKDGVYLPASDNDIKKIMLSYIERYRYDLQYVWAANNALCLLDCKATHLDHSAMNSDEKVINFKNGILDVFSGEFYPHTPKLLSTIQIPVNWTGNPSPTPYFDRFLETFTSGDKDKQKLLIEYMGAVLSNIYGSKFKKSLFIVGSGNSGKTLILSLLAKLLGSVNTSERSLKKLSERFGETAVYMKRLVFSGDLKFAKIDQMDRFKELTGGDEISIEYKNRDPFNYRFRGLLLFSMNTLPKFGGDKGEHVYDRMLIIKADNVIPKKERDPTLPDSFFPKARGLFIGVLQLLKR